MPVRTLLWLIALVLAAHVLVLEGSPLLVGLDARPQEQRLVFSTRQIPAPAPPEIKAQRARPEASKTRQLAKKPAPAKETPPSLPPSDAAEAAEVREPLLPPPEVTAEAVPVATPAASEASASPPPPVEQTAPAATAVATSLTIPPSVRLKYKLIGQARGLNYSASGVMTWMRDGDRYDASMVVSAFLIGSRSITSAGEVNADGIAPTRFSDKSRSELAAHFQPDKGKITFSANTPDAPWLRGAQDRLSVFFQLTGMLAGDPTRFTAGTKIPVYTAGPKDAETWSFTVDKQEDVALPLSTMPALKLTRDPRREFDQKIEIWYAPSLAYLPVRIKVTQATGDFIDQQLASLEKP